jgi:hypothetical protein
MKSARIVIEGENIRKIIDMIRSKEGIHYQYNTKDVVIFMEEEYYARIKSNLMSIYILNFRDERTVEIEMVAGGGKSDWDTDWGAEGSANKRMANSIIEICKQSSWSIVEVTPDGFMESLDKTATQQLMENIISRFKN